jgi:hypothetical protein
MVKKGNMRMLTVGVLDCDDQTNKESRKAGMHRRIFFLPSCFPYLFFSRALEKKEAGDVAASPAYAGGDRGNWVWREAAGGAARGS